MNKILKADFAEFEARVMADDDHYEKYLLERPEYLRQAYMMKAQSYIDELTKIRLIKPIPTIFVVEKGPGHGGC